ncbi:hypothetical protein PGTUg99_000518 [Puccinia graminis f. sp. tritici]|uniref:Uncharacterized protein n=1 Tax=Puccinia graminis f. sp. tritici TaxID=56615 RepID=A0A5B0RUT9_PUCGR|nr:hypothetical protein PGTUg99_009561 [Puccinia graminis f. sp. tritici]KAA1129168.1 hypothetical protein PGTUg99_000518 [Puccinia graminis f. sp. tritici]
MFLLFSHYLFVLPRYCTWLEQQVLSILFTKIDEISRQGVIMTALKELNQSLQKDQTIQSTRITNVNQHSPMPSMYIPRQNLLISIAREVGILTNVKLMLLISL